MTPRHWWAGIAVLALIAAFWHAVPRYEYHPIGGSLASVRVDRWTGEAVLGRVSGTGWAPINGPAPSSWNRGRVFGLACVAVAAIGLGGWVWRRLRSSRAT